MTENDVKHCALRRKAMFEHVAAWFSLVASTSVIGCGGEVAGVNSNHGPSAGSAGSAFGLGGAATVGGTQASGTGSITFGGFTNGNTTSFGAIGSGGTTGCYVPPPDPLPEPVACSTNVLKCEPGSDSCMDGAWSRTIRSIAVDCGAYCGEFNIAVRSGCVSDMNHIILTGAMGASDCILHRIIGSSWDCSPNEGWERVYVGSCTTQ